jgi:5-methyltetrahydropteroyltriglutamate--homocysteine methyltransferase
MTLISKRLPTTVVGSYPVVKGTGLRALVDPLKHAVEVAVADQIAAGIDIISDGQIRGDMIHAFTSHLPGVRGSQVVGKVQPAQKPITLADTRYALSKHSKVKGILTGPSTLAHSLKIETTFYRNREELILDLAQALAVEACYLQDAGVTILQAGGQCYRRTGARTYLPPCLWQPEKCPGRCSQDERLNLRF